MKSRLIRPSAALFPLALLAAQWITGDTLPSSLLVLYFAFQLFSLCAVDSFRNAAAREPGLRRVDRRFWGSFVMLLLPILLLSIPYFLYKDKFALKLIPVFAIPWLILIEQLFEERLFTLNRRFDGNILALISNGLLFAGLMLDGSGGVSAPIESFYTLAAAALAMLISIIVSLMIAPMKGFSLVPRNLGYAPKAMVQTLTYPALMFVCFELVNVKPDSAAGWGFYLGCILWRLSRTTCMRSADESRPLNLLLVAATGAMIIAGSYVSTLMQPAFCCFMALVCAMFVFLRFSWRNITAALLLFGAFVLHAENIDFHNLPLIACCLIAAAINLKHAFLKKV